MNSKNGNDWEAEYEKERKKTIIRMLSSRCNKCGKKCENVGEYTMGETHNKRWYCFDHVDLLYESMGVSNTSEFWNKTGRYR